MVYMYLQISKYITDGCIDVSPDKNGGVYKCIQREGVGVERAPRGSVIYSHYNGTLADGTIFGTSRDAGRLWTYVIGIGEWMAVYSRSHLNGYRFMPSFV